MLGDGVVDLHNLQTGGDEPKLKGWINQRLTSLNDNPNETWCRCASALNPRSCLKGTKAFPRAKPNTRFITWLVHFEETLNTEKPFTQKSFSRNNLWVERKTPSLALGKVTFPRGKLECRSYMLRPRVTRYLPIVDLGAVLPMRASGCVGCRRRENILGLLGLIIRIAACLKGNYCP